MWRLYLCGGCTYTCFRIAIYGILGKWGVNSRNGILKCLGAYRQRFFYIFEQNTGKAQPTCTCFLAKAPSERILLGRDTTLAGRDSSTRSRCSSDCGKHHQEARCRHIPHGCRKFLLGRGYARHVGVRACRLVLLSTFMRTRDKGIIAQGYFYPSFKRYQQAFSSPSAQIVKIVHRFEEANPTTCTPKSTVIFLSTPIFFTLALSINNLV